MQHLYTYNHKPASNKASYKTLFTFSAKLLLVILLAFLVMLINISKASANGQLDASLKDAGHVSKLTKGTVQ
jgi:hypothetical protein